MIRARWTVGVLEMDGTLCLSVVFFVFFFFFSHSKPINDLAGQVSSPLDGNTVLFQSMLMSNRAGGASPGVHR